MIYGSFFARNMLSRAVGPKGWRGTKMMSANSYSKGTIDDKEATHFGTWNIDWWDRNGKVRILHEMNAVRVPLIRDGVVEHMKMNPNAPKPLASASILEVGCGAGLLSEALARLGGTMHGIEVVPDVVRIAKRHASLDPSLTNLEYFQTPIEEFARNNSEKYDAVVLSEVIEHVANPERFLRESIKCAKPGGLIFVSTIHKTMLAWFVSVVLFEHVLGYIPRNTHHWDKYISVEDTKRLLEKYNCRPVKTENWYHKMFTRKTVTTKWPGMWYAVQAVKM